MRGTIDITGVLLIVQGIAPLILVKCVMLRLCQRSPEVVLNDIQVSWVKRGLVFKNIAPLVPRGTTSRLFMRRGQGR